MHTILPGAAGIRAGFGEDAQGAGEGAEGHYDWRPHPKSIPFGYLASLVATMPVWIEHMIKLDELDFAPVGREQG